MNSSWEYPGAWEQITEHPVNSAILGHRNGTKIPPKVADLSGTEAESRRSQHAIVQTAEHGVTTKMRCQQNERFMLGIIHIVRNAHISILHTYIHTYSRSLSAFRWTKLSIVHGNLKTISYINTYLPTKVSSILLLFVNS